jgi:DNA-binding cell septation regulator SpoVG
MHITIEHHNKSFNIALSSKDGRDPFFVLKGCRIVDGQKGRFISVPSVKMESGKYWNHAYISEGFQAEVLKAYDASTQKAATKAAAPADDDIPF